MKSRKAGAKLTAAIIYCAPSLEGLGFRERIQFMTDCIEHNETGVALETLCDNLFEFQLGIPQKALDLIREAGTIMGMESNNWDRLEPLIVDRTKPTELGFAEKGEDQDIFDEETARDIKNALRGRMHSDSANLLRKDRER